MPSTVGHALAGVAAAWAVDAVPGRRAWRAAPPHASWFRKAGGGLTLLCAAIAAAPDLDLLFHLHRTYSHSIGAVLLAALLAAAIAASRHRPAIRIAAMCALAYATHLFLDWLSVDRLPPYGLQALWPFTSRWFISGWDLFRQTERRRFLSRESIEVNMLAIAQETAILLPIAIVAWLVRVKALAGLSAEVARDDHAAE